jgi:hypothetical protein
VPWAERILADSDRPLRERLLESFDQWTGRYIGPMTREIAAVIEDNPDLLGTIAESTPRRFEELLTDGIAVESGRGTTTSVAQTLISYQTPGRSARRLSSTTGSRHRPCAALTARVVCARDRKGSTQGASAWQACPLRSEKDTPPRRSGAAPKAERVCGRPRAPHQRAPQGLPPRPQRIHHRSPVTRRSPVDNDG